MLGSEGGGDGVVVGGVPDEDEGLLSDKPKDEWMDGERESASLSRAPQIHSDSLCECVCVSLATRRQRRIRSSGSDP